MKNVWDVFFYDGLLAIGSPMGQAHKLIFFQAAILILVPD